MDEIAGKMPEQWLDSGYCVIDGKGKKQKWPVIIAIQAHSSKGIVGKPKFDIVPANIVDKCIVDYPIVVIPEKRVVQVKSIDDKTSTYYN